MFESGRSGSLAVATVVVSNSVFGPVTFQRPMPFGVSDAPDCIGLDQVPVDSLYVNYVDPDHGKSWVYLVRDNSREDPIRFSLPRYGSTNTGGFPKTCQAPK